MFLFCSITVSFMRPSERQKRLAALRDVIADIERKPALADMRAGVHEAPREGFPSLPGGLVQEVHANSARQGGASLGFALAQARSLVTPRRAAVVYVLLAREAQARGLPYGPGLSSFGFDPAHLVLVRCRTVPELLWTLEEALACRAVAAVVAELGGRARELDFTASRRLSLRAAEGGASLFLLRYGPERAASAAHLRWHVEAVRSARRPFDARAPGPPQWRARLERGVTIKRQGEWLLKWTEHGLASSTHDRGDAAPAAGGATLPGAVPAPLAHRLSQTA